LWTVLSWITKAADHEGTIVWQIIVWQIIVWQFVVEDLQGAIETLNKWYKETEKK